MTRRGRICFHAPFLYPLFSHGRVPFAGGAETQQATLARGLADAGFEVSAVTCDYGQPPEVVVDGIRLIRSYAVSAGLPGVRFVYPRLVKTVQALQRAGADLYYARGAGQPAGVAYDVARIRGAAFVFAAAHDHDTRTDLPLLPNPRDRWWYRRALRGADQVIAQSKFQEQAFRTVYDRESDVVGNLVALPERPIDVAANSRIVWLGTYKAAKRPEWFVALARALPDHQFIMRGVIPPPPLSSDAFDRARAAAAQLPNLDVGGHVPHPRLGELFEHAALFVHTSPAEGFPNTLLESWAWGVPAIACVNPDDLLTTFGLGDVVSDETELRDAVARWMTLPAHRAEAGARARRYVAKEHAPAAVVTRTAELCDRAISRRQGHAS